jgi:hypothetical protein
MKLKIILILLFVFMFFIIGCYNVVEFDNSIDLDNEKLAINDYFETIKNFENQIKIIDISEPQCRSGNSGGACYIDLVLQGYEKQNFNGIENKYFLGQTTAIRFDSEELTEEYLINQLLELENGNCNCEISDLSLLCECGKVFYNLVFSYNALIGNYISYPSYEANLNELKNNCIDVEFKEIDGIAYLNVDVRNFLWFDVVDCFE